MKSLSLILTLILTPLSVLCVPGELDPTFDGDGRLISAPTTGSEFARAAVVQGEGKIIIVGWTEVSGSPQAFVARYHPDGSLDLTFGAGGKVLMPGLPSRAFAVTFQFDGKIVVAGGRFEGVGANCALWRLHPDGAFDNTFGTGGMVSTPIEFLANDEFYGLAIGSDLQIVAVGTARLDGNHDFVVARYNFWDGSLDTTFDGDGWTLTPMAAASDEAHAVAIQSDNKIVVVGQGDAAALSTGVAIARYNPNGSLDTTFDGDGKVVRNTTGSETGRAVKLQSDGKLVIAGRDNGVFSIFRFNTNGSIDSSFNGNGRSNFGFASSTAFGVQIQPDGRIVGTGTGFTGPSGFFAVVRVNTDGTRDGTFAAPDGFATTSFGTDTSADARGVVLQPDGKIVAVGQVIGGPSTNWDVAVARYQVAKTLVVTNTNDSGTGSLRQAIIDASWGDHINFAPGVAGTITLLTPISVLKSVIINGPGKDVLTVSGNTSVAIFEIGNFTSPLAFAVTIRGLRLADGAQNGVLGNNTALTLADCELANQTGVNIGRMVRVLGILNMTGCLVTGNSNGGETVNVVPGSLPGLRGGSVTDSVFGNNSSLGQKLHIVGNNTDSRVSFLVARTTFVGNSSTECGGAISVNAEVDFTLRESAILNNQKGNGCGIGGAALDLGGQVRAFVLNTTMSGNSVTNIGGTNGPGGAISLNRFGQFSELTIVNSTITNNSSYLRAGGIFSGSGLNAVKIRNSIIAGNNAPLDPDVAAGSPDTIISQGHNLIGILEPDNITPQTGDQFGSSMTPIDARLAPLANNGGPSLTHAFLAGSPALDAGDNCVVESPGCLTSPLTTDQRGFTRMANGSARGLVVDIGAFEQLAPTAAMVSVGGQVVDQSGRPVPRAVIVIEDGSGAIRQSITNAFGYFSFEEVEAGQTYIVSVAHKRFSFVPRVLQVQDEVTDLVFVAE